jgi:hypothetical protein
MRSIIQSTALLHDDNTTFHTVTGRRVFDMEQYSGVESGMLCSRFSYADCLALSCFSLSAIYSLSRRAQRQII